MTDYNKIFSEKFSSQRNNRKKIVDAISGYINNNCENIPISPEELYLILDETVTNAMEHWNNWNPDKTVQIEVAYNSKGLKIIISDQGDGFDVKKFKKKLKDRNILSTRGRGIYIISQFCKPTWNDEGNQINIEIPLQA